MPHSDFRLIFAASLAWFCCLASVQSHAADLPTLESNTDALPRSENSSSNFLSFFGVLRGPSVVAPRAWQPDSSGDSSDRPVSVKNELTFGRALNENLSISGALHWIWKPVMGQEFQARDPYLSATQNSVFDTPKLNWRGELRVHLAVSNFSRDNDRLGGLQSFNILSYHLGTSRFTLGAYLSARVNFFGNEGNGNDLELYAAPSLNYQLSPALAASIVCEIGASHPFGASPWLLYDEGINLQPGLTWDITPTLTANPYLNLPWADSDFSRSLAIGMTVYWRLY